MVGHGAVLGCVWRCIIGHERCVALAIAALLRLTLTAITAVTVTRAALTALWRSAVWVGRSTLIVVHLCHGTFGHGRVVALRALRIGLATLATFAATFAAFATAFTTFTTAFAATFTTVASGRAFAQGVVGNVHGHR